MPNASCLFEAVQRWYCDWLDEQLEADDVNTMTLPSPVERILRAESLDTSATTASVEVPSDESATVLIEFAINHPYPVTRKPQWRPEAKKPKPTSDDDMNRVSSKVKWVVRDKNKIGLEDFYPYHLSFKFFLGLVLYDLYRPKHVQDMVQKEGLLQQVPPLQPSRTVNFQHWVKSAVDEKMDTFLLGVSPKKLPQSANKFVL